MEPERVAGRPRKTALSVPSVAAIAFTGAAIGLFCSSIQQYTLGSFDFRAFYAAGWMLREHRFNLYNLATQAIAQREHVDAWGLVVAFYHPSFECLLYLPWTFLTYRTAFFGYLIWNTLLLMFCYVCAPPAASDLRKLSRAALFCLGLPVWMCLFQGQNSLLFLLILCFIYRLLKADKDTLAGALLAVGLFKLQVTLVIAILIATLRGPRFLKGFAYASACVAFLCVSLVGYHGTVDFLHDLRLASLALDNSTDMQVYVNVWPDAMPSLYGMIYVCGGHLLRPQTIFALNSALSLALFTACLWFVKRIKTLDEALAIAISAGLLLGHHLFVYDLSALLLPILLLKGRALPYIALAYYVLPLALLLFRGTDRFAWAGFTSLAFVVASTLYPHQRIQGSAAAQGSWTAY